MSLKIRSNFTVIISIFLLSLAFDTIALQAHLSIKSAENKIHLYEVSFNNKLTEASVKICFDGKAPLYLAVDYRKAKKNIIDFPHSSDGYIEYQGRFWKTDNLKDNACIQYKSDISHYLVNNKTTQEDNPKLSFQSDNLWLWLPDKIQPNEMVHISFKLPEGFNLSTPWRSIEKSQHRFEIKDFSDKLGFTLMVGEFELRKIVMENGLRVNLAMLLNLKQKDNLQRWVLSSLNSVINYIGKINLSDLQVILIENQQFKTGVVPWGDLRRGGGLGVRFIVNSENNINDFYLDWTATHEFSHLLMPNIEEKDLWLSEGLSSYLQYILMAQSGIINEQEAWKKLYEGFQRGDQGTGKVASETLIEAIERKNIQGDYARIMRIYWTGAAYFFKADWLLRKNSGGKFGLPDLLLNFNLCCMNDNKEWSGELLSEKFDWLSQTTIFTSLYKEMSLATKFPEVKPVFSEIGIKISNGQVSGLSEDNNQIRKSILFKRSQQ